MKRKNVKMSVVNYIAIIEFYYLQFNKNMFDSSIHEQY